MPQLDGTGPRGFGPKTGRGMGSCKRNGCVYCPFFQENSETNLKNEEEILKKRLEEIQTQKKSLKNS